MSTTFARAPGSLVFGLLSSALLLYSQFVAASPCLYVLCYTKLDCLHIEQRLSLTDGFLGRPEKESKAAAVLASSKYPTIEVLNRYWQMQWIRMD